MKFPEINTLEDMNKPVEVSQWDLIKVAESFQRKGFYVGIWVGFGLVGLFVLVRSII
jgi:hypothetical protein